MSIKDPYLDANNNKKYRKIYQNEPIIDLNVTLIKKIKQNI
jgi:hypothetical protein